MSAKDRFGVSVPIVGGPQDGSSVKMYTDDIKPEVWVGKQWMGDGHAAFTAEGKCDRFPVKLEYDGKRYRHKS